MSEFLFYQRLTKLAPDAGDSTHILSSFHAFDFFWLNGLAFPTPAAGNANRWALAR